MTAVCHCPQQCQNRSLKLGRLTVTARLPAAVWVIAIGVCTAAWLVAGSTRAAGAETLPTPLTIAAVVELALSNSRGVADAVEARNLDRLQLENAQARYWPELNLGSTARTDWQGEYSADLTVQSSLRIITGATVTAGWSSRLVGEPANPGTITLAVSQRLLRGNWASEQISLRSADFGEERSLITFEAALESLIVAAVSAFRGLAAAQDRARISEEALERAQSQLRNNRILVQAGDLARRELVQGEAEIANREIDVAEARNRVLEARLRLVDVLDIPDPGPLELAPEVTDLGRVIPGFDAALETAFARSRAVRQANIAYQRALLGLEAAQQTNWDLSLGVGASRRIDREDTDFSGTARLSIPLGDRSPQLQVARARAGVAAAERAKLEVRQQLEIEVRRALNAALMSRERVALADRALALARDTLETERLKLNEGLSSSFQLSRVEQSLVQAERRVVNARTGYRNALLSLDRTLGTLQERWQVRGGVLDG